MPITTAIDPVSDLLRTAARLNLSIRPENLPKTAYYIYEAISDSLIPHLYRERERREHIALDTTVTLCAAHAGERLVPSTIVGERSRVGETILRCFTAHGGPSTWMPHTLSVLSVYAFGGLVVPSLNDLSNRVRDEQIRRDYGRGIDYPALARRYALSSAQVRRICSPAAG